MDLELRGRRVIITGGSRGIGAATAEVFAREGASLALIARNKERLEQTAEAIRGRHAVCVETVAVDLTSRGPEVEQGFARAISSLGGVDVLVNNAGESPFGTFDVITDDQWRAAFELKVMAAVRGIREVIPAMRAEGRGRIINVGGVGAVLALPDYALGALSAAVLHLTTALGEQLAPTGITVTAVNPGLIGTERFAGAMARLAAEQGSSVEELSEKWFDRASPIRRVIDAVEVGELIAYLASDRASAVTATSLAIDGGASRGRY